MEVVVNQNEGSAEVRENELYILKLVMQNIPKIKRKVHFREKRMKKRLNIVESILTINHIKRNIK